jgi:3,4-dihydroxy 2-butanone 4-phosphate synthase/GTP cyclohydrolase II
VSTAEVVERVLGDLRAAEARRRPAGRPFVTLAWAQSVDGSIALEAGKRLALSGPEALGLTHALRASHDTILVGIGTLLADDPELSVRHWNGKSPGPVVLDTRLRTPLNARILNGGRQSRTIRIACTAAADEEPRARLTARGAEILRLPAWTNGWVDLEALLGALAAAGVSRVMVEGGAKVLTSFLRAELGDFAVITIAPRLLGGLGAIGQLERARLPRLVEAASHRLAEDVVLSGPLDWRPA